MYSTTHLSLYVHVCVHKVFKHVRDTPTCAAAAAKEDDRATKVLADIEKPKVHAAAFLVRYTCSAHVVEQCLAKGLDAAGAQMTTVQIANGGLKKKGESAGSCGCFVARFACSCTSHTAHCGADLLHRTYSTLNMAYSDLAGESSSGNMKLLYASLIPKLDMAELCAQDYSHLLPSITLEGAAECARNAITGVTPADLSSLITIIVTTSPMRSDPDLDILETTFGSLALAGLEDCRKILVCDHLEIDTATTNTTTKFKGFKKGQLPAEYIQRYRQRLLNIREAQWALDGKIEVLELESWHGFALATLRALELVQTPLVCVIQHDLAFLRRVELAPIADVLLLEQPGVVRKFNFVNFPVNFPGTHTTHTNTTTHMPFTHTEHDHHLHCWRSFPKQCERVTHNARE